MSLLSCSKQGTAEESLQEAIVQQYRSVGKLLLTEATPQKAVTLQDPKISSYDISSFKDFTKWLSNQTRISNRVDICSSDVIFMSYTDPTDFFADSVTYDKDQQRLTLYIPPIQVELRGRGFTSRTEYEYVASLRNAVAPQDRARVKGGAYQVFQQEITANDQLIAQIRQRSIEKLHRWPMRLLLSYNFPSTVTIAERSPTPVPPNTQIFSPLQLLNIMGKWFKYILYTIITILLVIGIMSLWRSCSKNKTEDYSDIVTHAMTVRSIEEIFKLSTGKCYQEVSTVDTIDGMVLAYIAQARTYIGFDLDKLPTQVVGDTLYMQLPPEEVTPHEIGYSMINAHPLCKGLIMSILIAEQENRAKKRVPQRLINEVYHSGYIRNARQQAREELIRFLSVAYPTVVVVDHYPDGIRDTLLANTVYIDHRQM